jgi:hypothetical protein
MIGNTIRTRAGTRGHRRFFSATLVLVGLMLLWMSTFVCAADIVLPAGAIEIHTEPAGAYACIDRNYCQYTFSEGSAYFYGLDPTVSHTCTISKEGYKTRTGVFLLDAAGDSRKINATLMQL